MRQIPVAEAQVTLSGATAAARSAAAYSRDDGAPKSVFTDTGIFGDVRQQVLGFLSSSTPCCILRGTRFMEVPEADRRQYVAELALLFGSLSDSNVFGERSRTFVDDVRPSQPESKDVTFQLGACEVHSDESSKVRPEDVVVLWCVRPADWGGSSLLYLTSDLIAEISNQSGSDMIDVLRTPDFLFGGKLRQPPRVVRAPVLFGEDGVRYRLGTILDAAQVTSRPLRDEQQAALDALLSAIKAVPPYEFLLPAGDALVWMNRRALHSRSDFDDRQRLLYRTRCFNDELSNSTDDRAEWLTWSNG